MKRRETIYDTYFKDHQMFFKTPYNHDTDAETQKFGATGLLTREDLRFDPKLDIQHVDKPAPSKTNQADARAADINEIIKQFNITGQLPSITLPPTFADFGDVQDYHQAQCQIAETNSLFYNLPAETRAKFGNDPGAWSTFVNNCLDAGAVQPLVDMGIVLPEEIAQEAPETPQPDPGVSPAPDPLKAPPGGAKT